MDVTVILADAAQVSAGKLYILGAGWDTVTAPVVPPSAIALLILADTAGDHSVDLWLEDADGMLVVPEGASSPMRFHFDVYATPGPDALPGAPLTLPLALSLGPLALPPGRYRWVVEVDGETREGWQRPFTVVASAAPPSQ